ncbi:MAG: ATP-binding cassette domain-containing protein [Blastocatellia bacterium]|nr:ATP-binding cassette domain-containing protein [Blastocatellia bacterium]
MIKLTKVSKKYSNLVALETTDLEISRGKTTVLIGPSGCGKSTILRMIVGLIEPTTGVIEIDSQLLSKENILDIRRQLGYVIQDGGLFPHLTAKNNILLMARHLRKNISVMQERLEELCKLTHFSPDRLECYPLELSGGQRQRVGLMRALFLDPEILLLDEPLGALEPLVRSSLQQELKQIFQDLKKTVLLITHDLAEAAYLGDEIILMNFGKVVQRGTVDELQKQPSEAFVTQFLNAQRGFSL